ncbi:MAG: calcium-binding protein [Microcoleus sp.]
MANTLFLQPSSPLDNSNPNYAIARGGAVFSDYSQTASGTLTATEADTLVKGGVSAAIADAKAVFSNDPNFSALFTDSAVIGIGGASQGSSSSEAKVIANFSVAKNQTFSFDFATGLQLQAKEIENPKAEYNQAQGKTSFVVLETSDAKKPKVLDYFGMNGKLISSEQIGDLKLRYSRDNDHVTITEYNPTTNIDGNNGIDFVTGAAIGNYQRQFNRNLNITIVELNTSDTKFKQDTLIGKLGSDVIYGTIWNDKIDGTKDADGKTTKGEDGDRQLKGTNSADKIYGSLGDDQISGEGGDDILEGGSGKDKLDGGDGNDKLYGSYDNDTLTGGSGDDILVGGVGNDVMWGDRGKDLFLFQNGDSLLTGELDVIKDFKADKDQMGLQGWGTINASDLLRGIATSPFQIGDTKDGTILSSSSGGKVLLEGVKLTQLSANNFMFS